MMKVRWQLIGGLLAFWLLIVLYMSASLYQTPSDDGRTDVSNALSDLATLRRQNKQLQSLADRLGVLQVGGGDTLDQQGELGRLQRQLKFTEDRLKSLEAARNFPPSNNSASHAPYPEQLELLLKVENGLTELGFYLDSELGGLRHRLSSQPGGEEVVSILDHIISANTDQRRLILTDLYKEREASVPSGWFKQESQQLADIVQKRLQYLQNPADCSTAKKVVCQLNKGCGFGCQVHHATYCLLVAYGTGRMLVLQSRGWHYQHAGWQAVYRPVSEHCANDTDIGDARPWGPDSIMSSARVVKIPIIDHLRPRPVFMPLAIPEDLAPRLLRLHSNPAVWWIGQFVKYLMRPQPHLQKDIEEMTQKLRFQHPIVGVHVRRTDKVGTEAAFHDISEYMQHVDAYYDLLEKRQFVERRRVYLATDEPSLLADTRTKYPHYDVIGESEFARSAGLKSRYTDSSLRGIIMDIHFLSISDYLVCTFSSQVCRLAYELMQTFHPDADAQFHSLDDMFYYGGQDAHNQVALMAHTPQRGSEIELRPGDVIGIAGNHWDGFSKGLNRRTGKHGLYPSYKVRDEIRIARFPTYPEAGRVAHPRTGSPPRVTGDPSATH